MRDGILLLGSRGSQLALAQANQVRGMLRERFPELAVEIAVIKTEGDIDRDSPLSSFGGRGAFVRSIENALLYGEIDIAVHSLKDLPSRLPEGLTLGATPVREDPRDALVASGGRDLEAIPDGESSPPAAIVGVSNSGNSAPAWNSVEYGETSKPASAISEKRASMELYWPAPVSVGWGWNPMLRRYSSRKKCSPPPVRERWGWNAAKVTPRRF